MKKLLLLLSITLLLSCEPAVNIIPETEITTETEPDIVEDEIIPEITREIIYTNIFKISGSQGDITTPLELSGSILKYNDTEYNIETMTPDVNGLPVKTTYTGTERIISIDIEIDFFTSFYFINNNMIDIKNIDPQNMRADEFKEILTFIYAPPEPEIPVYSETRYHLSGYSGDNSDHLTVNETYILINGIYEFYDEMDAVYIDNVRKIMINMSIDNKDSFLFINNNMFNFFGISFDDLSYSELIIACDVLNRYPEEGLLELMGGVYP